MLRIFYYFEAVKADSYPHFPVLDNILILLKTKKHIVFLELL